MNPYSFISEKPGDPGKEALRIAHDLRSAESDHVEADFRLAV